MAFTFRKKTRCGKDNYRIAHFLDDGKKKYVYYTECQCTGVEEEKFRQLTVDRDIEIQPIPFFRPGQRIGPISICASSGSGKSIYCRKLTQEILDLAKLKIVHGEDGELEFQPPDPNKKPPIIKIEGVYLLTAATETDPAFSKFPPIRLDIDDAMENQVEIENFRNSVVIFDDFKKANKRQKQKFDWVNNLRMDLLDKSRKLGIHLLICNHRQRAGHDTALENIEAQAYVVFYRSNKVETRKLLSNYVDMTKSQIDELINRDDGMFSTAYVNRNPSFVITKHYMYFY